MKNNVLDLLLQVDVSKLKRPVKEVEMKRLSNITGQKVIFLCEGLNADEFDDIQDRAIKIDIKRKDADFNVNEAQIFSIIEGVKEPSFKDKALMDKFNVLTPKDLVKVLLLPGEISELYNIIAELSGFGEDMVSEIKNS